MLIKKFNQYLKGNKTQNKDSNSGVLFVINISQITILLNFTKNCYKNLFFFVKYILEV